MPFPDAAIPGEVTGHASCPFPMAEDAVMTKDFRLFVGLLAIGLIFLASKPLHAILLAVGAFFILRPRLIWWQY